MTDISFGQRDRDSFLQDLSLDERVLPLYEGVGEIRRGRW